MEDDPYYYLQFKPGEAPRGFKNLGVSYLSMDTENRVLRLDSFSKVNLPCYLQKGSREKSGASILTHAWSLYHKDLHDSLAKEGKSVVKGVLLQSPSKSIQPVYFLHCPCNLRFLSH